MAIYKAGQIITSESADFAIELKEIPAAVSANGPISVTPDGYLAGTASTPTVDRAGHKVLSGAFDESIRTKGLSGPKGIMLLAHHNWEKPAGVIKELKTINGNLRIGAQLNLNVSYVKDLYESIKDMGGLSFSVGFRLQEYKFAEDEVTKDDILVVEKGELMEISIVGIPAQPDATMDFVKSGQQFIEQSGTPSEFEKALIANGWVMNRRDANQLMKLCKNSAHLLTAVHADGKSEIRPARPMLDAHQLKAASDLTSRLKGVLSGAC